MRIVRENTLSLQKLIEDLLTYHQTRAMEPATLGPVPLPEVVRRVLREQKLAGLARMITFDAQLAPAVVIGDGEKIRTVVDNLLSNAIKYSPRSGVIEITLAVDNGFAVLDVSDHGPGIAPAERERVFESFYSGTAPPDGKVKGSGLGLAIAREYALAHGGRVEVLDRADKGARGALPSAPAGGAGRGRPAHAGPCIPVHPGSARGQQVTRRGGRGWRRWSPAPCSAHVRACRRRVMPTTVQEEYEPELVQVPTPLVEYPPIEPVEPPPVAEPEPAPPPQPAAVAAGHRGRDRAAR